MPGTGPKTPLASMIPPSGENFVPPLGRPPRESYVVRESRNNRPRRFTRAEVFRVDASGLPEEKVAEYESVDACVSERFEPFRQLQGGYYHDYALISPKPNITSALDLETGQIVAEEKLAPTAFYPEEFYVPDWREVHDKDPFTQIFSDEDLAILRAWYPRGDFGFVSGSYWGDEGRWKVQFLDLSHVSEGKIVRGEHFGYVELAPGIKLSQAITIQTHDGRVVIAVPKEYDLITGAKSHQ